MCVFSTASVISIALHTLRTRVRCGVFVEKHFRCRTDVKRKPMNDTARAAGDEKRLIHCDSGYVPADVVDMVVGRTSQRTGGNVRLLSRSSGRTLVGRTYDTTTAGFGSSRFRFACRTARELGIRRRTTRDDDVTPSSVLRRRSEERVISTIVIFFNVCIHGLVVYRWRVRERKNEKWKGYTHTYTLVQLYPGHVRMHTWATHTHTHVHQGKWVD